jgi:hypothetical protein
MPQPISQLADYTTITGSAFVPIVDVNESVLSKNKKISIDDLRDVYFKSGVLLSSSFTRHTPGFYYFGDNRDGRLNLTGSIATVRTFVSRSFASTQDGPPVIKNFSSLFISRSVVVSPTVRCRGMLIFVDGDATISGSISMTARGAKFTGSDASFRSINPPYLGDYWSTQLFPSSSYLSRVFAIGASGGPAGPTPSSVGGTGVTGTLGRSGGGGGGGGQAAAGGAGSAGTSFSGGSGGGGGGPSPGANGFAFGGQGGPTLGYGGGGAGNPGGVTPAAAPSSPLPVSAPSGTGGLLILIVRGNLKIGPNGSIAANGISGGNGLAGFGTAGGGGSGGGVLYIYYGGTLTNNGTVTSNGGSGGLTGTPATPTVNQGGAGGAGTAIISKLNTAFPVAN